MAEPVANTLIDGRYRVISRLGAGGMADVYLAEDEQLSRKVALKLLHRRFAEDPDFVERFRREAQAAAGLQHPNVVSVYDRGSFDDTYYIAMEYLQGRSLKQLIRQEAPLDPVRAIDIVLQILQAARFAHRRGVIHRDLKPHNVIVDDSGQAKVTDFGIARAGASDMTETGSIMGTAQYLSPEQAQGHAVNAASDLYSVGVVLYEMLTGRVPFDGESPVTIALKHVAEAPVPPSALNPNIPPELEQTVLWVLNKDAADRPADADQLITVLQHCREAIVSGAAGQHTASMAAVAAAGAAAGGAAGPVIASAYTRTGQPTNGTGQMATLPPSRPPRSRRWVPWAWAALVLLLVAGAAGAAYLLSRPKQTTVPDVRGQPVAIAERLLEGDHLQPYVVHRSSTRPVGIVIAEAPAHGTRIDRNSTVTLTVSSGRGEVSIPPVRGLTVAAATRALHHAGLKVADKPTQTSTSVPAGKVIGTDPGVAKSVRSGYGVTLIVSSGQPPVSVPPVVGDSQTQAAAQLAKVGLNPVVKFQQSKTVAAGNVISQSPKAGTKLRSGKDVTIVVATAPQTVTVPLVVGDPVAGAENALRAAGLNPVPTTRTVASASKNGIVVSQTPGGNSSATKGTRVTIVVGRFTSSSSSSSSTSSTTTSRSSSSSSTTTSSTSSNPASPAGGGGQ